MRLEIELQDRRHNIEKIEKKRTFKYCLTIAIVQLVVFLSLFTVLQIYRDKAVECHSDIERYMTYCMYYFAFSSFRQVVVVLLIPFSKKPTQVRDRSNFVFITMDFILYSSLTIWGTRILIKNKAIQCSESNDTIQVFMWVFSLACLLYGWVYVILLCCGLTSMPLIFIFWCVYRMQMRQMEAELGPNHL